MRKIKTYGIALCLAAAMLTGTDMKVEAQSNFNSYTYDEWDGWSSGGSLETSALCRLSAGDGEKRTGDRGRSHEYAAGFFYG